MSPGFILLEEWIYIHSKIFTVMCFWCLAYRHSMVIWFTDHAFVLRSQTEKAVKKSALQKSSTLELDTWNCNQVRRRSSVTWHPVLWMNMRGYTGRLICPDHTSRQSLFLSFLPVIREVDGWVCMLCACPHRFTRPMTVVLPGFKWFGEGLIALRVLDWILSLRAR